MSKPPEGLESYWTAAQVAEYLNVSIHTVRKWQERGRIPHIKLAPRCIRYHPDTIRAWIEAQATRVDEPATPDWGSQLVDAVAERRATR